MVSRSSSNNSRQEEGEYKSSKCIGVFGLDRRTTENALEDFFSQYGRIAKTCLIRDKYNESRRFGFITYEDSESARLAVEKAQEQLLDGRPIRVDFSQTNGPHNPTPGQYLGRSRHIGHQPRYQPEESYYRERRYRDQEYYPERNHYRNDRYREDYGRFRNEAYHPRTRPQPRRQRFEEDYYPEDDHYEGGAVYRPRRPYIRHEQPYYQPRGPRGYRHHY